MGKKQGAIAPYASFLKKMPAESKISYMPEQTKQQKTSFDKSKQIKNIAVYAKLCL